MSKNAQKRIAEEAARFMVDGLESEYLHAKERAVLMLGLTSQTRFPSNREIKQCIANMTRTQLGGDEVSRRLNEMRMIAEQIMTAITDHDPFLIGSTLSGQIRAQSDIDLHAYSDDVEPLKNDLVEWGYEDIDEELVENQKGSFVHLRWQEHQYPVEITIYPWSWRDILPISSVTGKSMKRADLRAVQQLLKKSSRGDRADI